MDKKFAQLHIYVYIYICLSHMKMNFACVHDDMTPQHFAINIFKSTEQIDSSMFHHNANTILSSR